MQESKTHILSSTKLIGDQKVRVINCGLEMRTGKGFTTEEGWKHHYKDQGLHLCQGCKSQDICEWT